MRGRSSLVGLEKSILILVVSGIFWVLDYDLQMLFPLRFRCSLRWASFCCSPRFSGAGWTDV